MPLAPVWTKAKPAPSALRAHRTAPYTRPRAQITTMLAAPPLRDGTDLGHKHPRPGAPIKTYPPQAQGTCAPVTLRPEHYTLSAPALTRGRGGAEPCTVLAYT